MKKLDKVYQGKRLAILGGGAWQIPTIERAKALGLWVVACGLKFSAKVEALADAIEKVDIGDPQAILKIAQNYRVDGVLSDSSDAGVPAAAYAAEQLHLPTIGHQVGLNFTDKLRMREITSRGGGVPNPKYGTASSLAEALDQATKIGYPIILKPRDAQSSRGVYQALDSQELCNFFRQTISQTKKNEILIEELIRGTEVTVESAIHNGKVTVLGVSDKAHFESRPQVAYRLTYPPRFSKEIVDKIVKVNSEVIRQLGLRSGITHAEYMIRDGEPYLMEIAARGGGSRIHSHISPYLSGFDTVNFLIDLSLGLPIDPVKEFEPRSANLEFFNFPAGKVLAIRGVEEALRLSGVQEIFLEFKVGDTLLGVDDDRSRPGFMLLFGKTRDDVLELAQKVKDLVRVEVQALDRKQSAA